MTVRTQTRYPGTVVSDDSNGGTVAWADPEKAEVQDNDPATAGPGPGISEYLKFADHDFNVLSTAGPTVAHILARRRTLTTGLADIGFIGAQSNAGSGGTSITVNVPEGTLDGHAMFLFTGVHFGISPPTPSGWTLIGSRTYSDGEEFSAVVRAYTRAASDEPASYEINFGNTNTKWATIATFENVDLADMLASSVQEDATAGSTNHTSASVTTDTDKAVLIKFTGTAGVTADFGAPSGMTLVAQPNVGPTRYAAIWREDIPSAGATGTRIATTTSSTPSGSIMFAVKPAVTRAADDAVRLVVGDVIGDDDYSGDGDYPDAYEDAELGPIDISALTPADINASDFGGAISAALPDGVVAGIDIVRIEIAYDIAVDVTITDPTSTLDSPNATLEWTAEVGGSAIAQASYRVTGRVQPSNVLVYDSGVIASATQEHQIGSGTPVVAWASPQDGQVVRWTVTVTEDGTADPDGVGDNISGSEAVDLTNDWTLPTAPTGLAAVAVTEEV